jgi:hypothetical protein
MLSEKTIYIVHSLFDCSTDAIMSTEQLNVNIYIYVVMYLSTRTDIE